MSRNPDYQTIEAPESRPTGFNITAVIGHVEFENRKGGRSPMEAAMLAIAPDAELATPGMPERIYRFDLTGREQDYTTIVVVPPEARS